MRSLNATAIGKKPLNNLNIMAICDPNHFLLSKYALYQGLIFYKYVTFQVIARIFHTLSGGTSLLKYDYLKA